jgi:hypothetical protein
MLFLSRETGSLSCPQEMKLAGNDFITAHFKNTKVKEIEYFSKGKGEKLVGGYIVPKFELSFYCSNRLSHSDSPPHPHL